MLKAKKGLAVSMAITLLITSTGLTTVLAKNDFNSTNVLIAKKTVNSKEEKKTSKQDSKKDDKKVKDSLENEKIAIESNKTTLEEKKTSLEEQYKAAVQSGDTAKAAELQKQIKQIETDLAAIKQQLKEKKAEIKAAIKANYSSEELKKLDLVSNEIKKKNKNVTVLPVESIIVKGINVKFDTPPVIKSGRTLIPVKALSQAFGATVQWIAAEKKVIISKGDKQIVLTLDSNKIYVNGVEKTLDVPACSINSRTVVPLKFIVEQLGLKVNWNKDTKDIEIEDGDTTTPPPTTTGSAIVVTTNSAIQVNTSGQ
jgi:hypothetical protein